VCCRVDEHAWDSRADRVCCWPFLYCIIYIVVAALLEGVLVYLSISLVIQRIQTVYHRNSYTRPTTCLTSSSLLRHIIACCITAPFPPGPTH